MLSEDMYRENILDHFRHPHNHGVIANPSVFHKEYNPACGDLIEVYLLVSAGAVREIKFSGHGCAISQASMSMLSDKLIGLPIRDVLKITKEDMLAMLRIPVSATRLKCALLGLRTVGKALVQLEAGTPSGSGAKVSGSTGDAA